MGNDSSRMWKPKAPHPLKLGVAASNTGSGAGMEGDDSPVPFWSEVASSLESESDANFFISDVDSRNISMALIALETEPTPSATSCKIRPPEMTALYRFQKRSELFPLALGVNVSTKHKHNNDQGFIMSKQVVSCFLLLLLLTPGLFGSSLSWRCYELRTWFPLMRDS